MIDGVIEAPELVQKAIFVVSTGESNEATSHSLTVNGVPSSNVGFVATRVPYHWPLVEPGWKATLDMASPKGRVFRDKL